MSDIAKDAGIVDDTLPNVAVIGFGHVGRRVAGRLDAAVNLVVDDKQLVERPPLSLLASCSLGIICVGTPQASDGSCDLTAVEGAVSHAPMDLLWIRSTVPPGTCDALARRYGKRICHSPEFVGETDYSDSYDLESFLILGGNAQDRQAVLEVALRQRRPPDRIHLCSNTESELVKYMENAFLALRVGFVNEFHDLAETLGADWQTVREGWLLDPRVGRSHTMVFPHDRGFGGKCLPKDVDAIRSLAAELDVSMPILDGLVDLNRRFRG